MHIDQQVIDLATGIQRRHDFTAHVTGFAAGAVVIGSLNLAGVRGIRLYATTLLTWAGDCPVLPALPARPARPGHRRRGPRRSYPAQPVIEPD
jgi:hypothetical protein